MNPLPKRAFVTGASGFIGSWLCRRLLNEGYVVAAAMRRAPQSDELFGRLGLIGSVTVLPSDTNSLSDQLASFSPSLIVNLAGQSQVKAAFAEPSATFEVNTAYVWDLLEAVRRLEHNVSVILASTDAVYGGSSHEAYREDAPVNAMDPYAASKAAAEIVARSFAKAYDLAIVLVRLSNVYGPGDRNVGRLIPDIIGNLSVGKAPILRDSAAVRSYLYIDDAITALLQLAARAADAEIRGQVFNVAGSTSYSSLDVARIACTVLGRPDLEPAAPLDQPHSVSVRLTSTKKIEQCLGWRPSVPLDEGLRRLVSEQENLQ